MSSTGRNTKLEMMAEYQLQVSTGNLADAGTWDRVSVTLFGSRGQSEKTELDNYGIDFISGKTGNYTIKTSSPLGELLLLKVEKESNILLLDDEWYCSKIVVKTPEGEELLFPCYRWVSNGQRVELRGGRAVKVFEEEHPMLIEHRRDQLALKRSMYKWSMVVEGLPHYGGLTTPELPSEVRFSKSRMFEIKQTVAMSAIELKIKGLLGSAKSWKSINDMRKLLWFKKTKISEYAAKHWKEDDFYGYQFLNGINPHVIRRCSELPLNFPVTQEMVKPFLEAGSSLQDEMKKGRVFIFDQRDMDGIPGRMYNGERLQVTAGLCLLYLDSENKLKPIAIQLQQRPSKENPIFLPSDHETDWLLAKMFIRNAEYMDHQGVRHLMNTHFLAEVFAVATLRCFPLIHPLYKLLIPHFRYTLNINTEGRRILMGPKDGLSQYTLGYDGTVELMKRCHAKVTYSSLCLPDDIAARGLASIPNFHYRDDGLKLWTIINSFVGAMVKHFYPSDSDVLRDTELQEWISEIFTEGFLGNKSSGFPSCFRTTGEVIKFITMVIFIVSAQHSAVNNGQFDYQSFVPNGSLLLRRPPPVTKGLSSEKTMLEILPNVGEAAKRVAMACVLSEKYTEFVPLGSYPEERFQEAAPKKMIKEFQAKLADLSEAIRSRNAKLEIPYTYLDPAEMENSVTI